MHPILIDFGLFELPTYGLLLAAAFLLALWLLGKLARREGIEADHVSNLWVTILLAGLIGAKLTLYLVEWRLYWENPANFLSTWRSAGVYYGGFVAAAVTAAVYMRRHGLPLGKLSDVLAPALALGQSVGRWGCMAAGCCFGKPAGVPWAITFTDQRAHEITGVPLHQPLHPTQAYLSLNALLLCGILLLLLRAKRTWRWPDGIVFWAYVLLYGATRFVLEYYRNDNRGQMGALSTSQFLGLAGAAVATVALVLLARRRRSSP